MAASYGGREARLLEAGLALTLDRELPAVLRRLVALASELTGARSSVLGVLGANNVVVEVISTAPDGPDLGPAGLPAPGPGVLRLRVKVRGVAFGDLCVTGKRDAADFDEDDRRALEALAAYAGVAIENARVLVPGPREGTLVMEVVIGPTRGLRGVEIPIDHSVAGRVIQTGKAEIVAHLGTDPRAFQPVAELRRPGPAMFVPLRARQEPFGALVVIRRVGDPGFGEADVELVEGFADLAAVAYEYASVHRELRRLAIMEERERIARDLHDGAIQALFSVGMGLQATAARTGEPEVTRRLHGAVGELDRVISDLRSYIFGLRPGGLPGRVAVLEVDDDGVGFDPRASRPGHGLGNLSARAAALGGSLELESSSGEGTTVRVLIPL